jgi:hypothetical protein
VLALASRAWNLLSESMLRKIRATIIPIKRMVQVTGTTYRITRTNAGVYEVTRISDDARAGSFVLGPPTRFVQGVLDANELRSIARAALQNAITG